MGKIKRLPQEIARKIAAGEVIERPASVVKELVENALDAGASRVEIDLDKGGKALIRVRDDGQGIPAEDLPLAVERHATSKIGSEADLEAIRTLGFRGEALAAIGSVSHLIITSRPPETPLGARVEVRFGQKSEVVEAGCPQGTVVEVADLFANLPARRRFLKSDRAETTRILETVKALSLAWEGVSFRLKGQGRLLLNLPREDLPDRLGRLLGLGKKDFLPLSLEKEGVKLFGFLSRPEKARHDPRSLYFYVLRRPVKSSLLARALNEATKGFFMSRSYPAGAIFLDLPPERIDVNVHPAKLEVRFRTEGQIFSLLHQAVRQALLEKSRLKAVETRPFTPQLEDIPLEGALESAASSKEAPVVAESTFNYHSPGPRPLGQILATYILCEGDEGLVIYDQHALHERILYEKLRRAVKEKGLAGEPLLFPVVFEAQAPIVEAAEEARRFLQRLGIEARPYGPGQIAVYSWPRGFLKEDIPRVVSDILGRLSQGRMPEGSLLHEILALLACRAAVKAGDHLTEAEMTELLKEAERFPSDYCPHGRPTSAYLKKMDLERLFRRK